MMGGVDGGLVMDGWVGGGWSGGEIGGSAGS
jgi:hypothetical protein